VVRRIHLGLDAWPRFATHDLADIGLVALIHPIPGGFIKQQAIYYDMQVGFLVHLTLHAFLFTFVGLSSTAWNHQKVWPLARSLTLSNSSWSFWTMAA
jgi:hypothetical protein